MTLSQLVEACNDTCVLAGEKNIRVSRCSVLVEDPKVDPSDSRIVDFISTERDSQTNMTECRYLLILVYRRNRQLRCYGLFHSFAPLCKQ